ncbi:MAG: GntR family transcriptional regulator [Candidatus Pelethousia sp.]|nr:GntR family transcriptional regulator [Candidatus Pelethousia sp.]
MRNECIEYLSTYRTVISATTGIPIYSQLEYILANMIDENVIGDGEEFFSEEEISDALGISRPTVNKAMNTLIDKGYITRERGKRSYVSSPHKLPLLFIEELISFGEMLDRQKIEYSTKLLTRQICRADSLQSQRLRLAEGSELVHLQRLRFVMDEPIIVVDSWCDAKRFHWLMDIPAEGFSASLIRMMQEKMNIKIEYAEREVFAARMNAHDALLLQASLWEPCMNLRSTNYDTNHEPVEMFSSRLKGNRCVLRTKLEAASKK